ncbi:MAG: enoyl-CoA hydratase/isomerase family protein, partial [Luteimonas sp.]
MSALILSADHGAIRELTLARPPVNALNPALCDALRDTVAQAVADGVEGLVLVGGPKVFSAGLDVPHLLTLEDRGALLAAWEAFFGAARALAECPTPVVAAIAGHAPAGGCVLALCCDYRVMASGPFRIGLNETQVGLAVPAGVMRLMQRVVGQYRAERLLI